MSAVVAIGVTHRSAPLELLERMSIDASMLPKYLDDLAARENISEAVIISTCNRTEIIVGAEKFHGAYRDVRDFLSDLTFLPPDEFSDHLVVSYHEDASEHVFSIAAGLDSVVIGEHEILGQMRDAWELARSQGHTGPTLNLLFRHAIEVGKRARSETEIGQHVTSVSHAAVILATDRMQTLAGRRVAVIGAGSMARGVADFAWQAGARDITVVNRTATPDRDITDAASEIVPLSALPAVLESADVIFSATAAPGALIVAEDVETAMARRSKRHLFFVDIAVPRDVCSSVNELADVEVLDMDDIGAFSRRGLADRANEVPAVEEIVRSELSRYRAASSAREAAPLISKLRGSAERVVTGELERHGSKLDSLTEEQRSDVEALLNGVVGKLLHRPTVSLKDSAGTIRGERLAGAMRELFDL